ncbi:MAG: hypothetical protein C4526_00370 [Nitrospiraceae bacterium]|nr:MAG: hypothetical protein C4526_00370 [Nitrospiraceae bacterium]
MNYFKYLKSSLPAYIISGVLSGLAAFSLVTVHRYNNFLENSYGTIENINLKGEDVGKEIARIDALTGYFQDTFGVREDGFNAEKLILRALDEMKAGLNNSSITVSRFEDAGGEKQLPVEIRVPVTNYRTVINYTGYVESFRLPDFRIKDFSLIKEAGGGVILIIQGSFTAPKGGSL